MTPNVRLDRARRLHPTFDSINKLEKDATRAPVQRFVRRALRSRDRLIAADRLLSFAVTAARTTCPYRLPARLCSSRRPIRTAPHLLPPRPRRGGPTLLPRQWRSPSLKPRIRRSAI